MANLERFIEELMSFDEVAMPESTLVLVEPYLRKASFDHVTLEKKTHNSACASLCRWVRGVCRYHRMMISKVKPLHAKVEQTTQAIEDAEHKMSILENKRHALETRLRGLERGFEEATIDKNDQEKKTVRMDKLLETAARLHKVLRKERMRLQQVIDSLPARIASIGGSIAISAAFATYLGPYHYSFRRLMLTVHWPNCLRERGVPLVIDSIDELKGRVVDWRIPGLSTTPADGDGGVMETGIPEDAADSEPDDREAAELEEILRKAEERESQAKAAEEEKEGKEGETPSRSQTASKTQPEGEEEESAAKEKGDDEESEKGGKLFPISLRKNAQFFGL